MILGVDVGGTKTLIELFEHGEVHPVAIKKIKRPTPDKYQDFITLVSSVVDEFEASEKLKAACFAIPGPISKDGKSVHSLGNKNWTNIHVVDDFTKLLKCPVMIQNDAKLGALSEAISGAGQPYNVSVYITISTGIGIGVIVENRIEPEMSRDEVGMMPFIRNNKSVVWEDFASARAFNQRFDMFVSDAEDTSIWDEFSKDIALGLSHIILTINSEAIIMGGPVGAQFKKFKPFLLQHLENYLSVKKKLLVAPDIVQAKYPNQCVIRGCFYAAKQLLE